MKVSQRKNGDRIVLKDGALEIRLYILRVKNGRMHLGIDAPPSMKIIIETHPKEKAH